MAFYLDTNFFIEAHRKSYPLDVASTFWMRLKELADSGIIKSIDKVKQEIFSNDDELKQWCIDNLPSDFFQDTAGECVSEYSTLAQWAVANADQFTPQAVTEFLDKDEADAWLIATCCKRNAILITYEIGGQGSKKKIKIPDASEVVGVKCMSPIDMFRTLGITF